MSHRWTVWVAAFAGSFGILEGDAIAKGKQTLSLWLRWAIGIEPKHWRRFILAPLFGGLLTWLGFHVLGDLGPHLERPQR